MFVRLKKSYYLCNVIIKQKSNNLKQKIMATKTIYRAYQINGNEYEDFNHKDLAVSTARYQSCSKKQAWGVKEVEIYEKLELVDKITDETWKKAVNLFVKNEGYCEVEQGNMLVSLNGHVEHEAVGEYDADTDYQESESTLSLNVEDCYVAIDEEEKQENIPFYVLEKKFKYDYDNVFETWE